MSGQQTSLTSVDRASHTKIVATIGPATDSLESLTELIRAGVDVFRINTAHGTPDDHERMLGFVRAAAEQVGHPAAVLVDLAGPKIRLGELSGGEVTLAPGDLVQFVRGDTTNESHQLVCSYETLIDELEPGDRVMLADGTVVLQVARTTPDAAECRVDQGGTLRSRQGVNLPGVRLGTPSISDRDRSVALWAAESRADFISLSFVRTGDEVRELRDLVGEVSSEACIVAKIEKPEALENLSEIVHAADAVMVARGDLGVEIDIARIAVVQKQIVHACRSAHKPVIIATQMLDSMHDSRIPTRAEATDVANAILDGADACMLSGETAIGSYPVESVRMMHRIAMATEPAAGRRTEDPTWHKDIPSDIPPITHAVTRSAARIAEELEAELIVVASASGRSALSISQTRTLVPTIGVSSSDQTLRRMCLYWGVVPMPSTPMHDDQALLRFIIDRGRQSGRLKPGDRIVLVSGTGLVSSRHNAIIVEEIR